MVRIHAGEPHPKSITSHRSVLLDASAVCGRPLSQTYAGICVSARFSGWKDLRPGHALNRHGSARCPLLNFPYIALRVDRRAGLFCPEPGFKASPLYEMDKETSPAAFSGDRDHLCEPLALDGCSAAQPSNPECTGAGPGSGSTGREESESQFAPGQGLAGMAGSCRASAGHRTVDPPGPATRRFSCRTSRIRQQSCSRGPPDKPRAYAAGFRR